MKLRKQTRGHIAHFAVGNGKIDEFAPTDEKAAYEHLREFEIDTG